MANRLSAALNGGSAFGEIARPSRHFAFAIPGAVDLNRRRIALAWMPRG
jgi:hypothetical protein